jgi:hypothetical protein
MIQLYVKKSTHITIQVQSPTGSENGRIQIHQQPFKGFYLYLSNFLFNEGTLKYSEDKIMANLLIRVSYKIGLLIFDFNE